MSGKGFIAVEHDGECELCGEIAELRPYGPNGEKVCFACGMRDLAAARRGFAKYMLGQDVMSGETREAFAQLDARRKHKPPTED